MSPALLFDPLLVLLVMLAVALAWASRRGRGADRESPRRARWGLRIAWAAWAVLWLFATPRFSFGVLSLVETPPVDVREALGDTPEERCVMVVLSGGSMTPRPGVSRAELLSGASLPRAIGAARIYRERPVGHVIVTGRASPWGVEDETAAAMADVMVAHGVPRERIVVEPLARDTRQNALFSSMIAREIGAEKTVVVTSALHMPRTLREFARAGMPVIGAPVDHRYEPPEGVAPYVPSVASLLRMGQVVHELLGRYKP